MNQDKLNEILFAQIERLNKSNGEQLKEEIIRANAVVNISRNIIENARLSLDAQVALSDTVEVLPSFFNCKRDLEIREQKIQKLINEGKNNGSQ